jgi:hypothetical protein
MGTTRSPFSKAVLLCRSGVQCPRSKQQIGQGNQANKEGNGAPSSLWDLNNIGCVRINHWNIKGGHQRRH